MHTTTVNGSAVARATAVDAASGAVFVTGNFTGRVAFGSTMLTSAGGNDVFVARYDPATATWAWAQRAGGAITDVATGVATDGTNVYVTGSFITSATFFAGEPAATTLSGTSTEAFVAAYAAGTGTGVWAKGVGGSATDVGYGVATDGTNVYVTGSFLFSASFFAGEPAATTLTGGTNEAFVAAYAASTGTGQWVRSAGGSGNDVGQSVATDGTNVYVTGYFTTSATFFATQPAATTLTGTGQEIFVAAYTAGTGTGIWAKSAGGSGNNDVGYGVATNGTSVYVTGSFNASADFFAGQPAAATLTGANNEAFVAAFTASTGAGQWARSAGGSGNDVGQSVAIDGATVYATGSFTTSANFFVGQPAATTLSGSGQEVFVAAYTAGTGTGVWAMSAGGNGSADFGYGVAVGGNEVYAVGGTGLAAVATYGSTAVPPGAAVLGTLSKTTGAWQGATASLTATGNSQVHATAVDKVSGAVFVTGQFTGQVAFGSHVLISAGSNDAFVARYNPATAAWAWAKSAGGGNSDQAYGLATDGTNVYVTGSFNVNASFFAGQPAATTLSSSGGSGQDVFVAAYAASTGAGQWAQRAGGTGSDSGSAVAIDGTNVYVTGSFNSSAGFFAGQPGATTLSGSNDEVFVAAYAAGTGTGLWAKSAGGISSDVGGGVATDGTNVYVTGYFSTSASFFAGQPGATTLTGTNIEVFVAAYTAGTGTGVWAKSAGGPNNDFGQGVATDGTNVYVMGNFDASAGFFAGQAAATTLSGPNNEVFVAAYAAGTGTGQWAKSAGGSSFDTGNGVATDGTSVYVTGAFTTNAVFFTGQLAATTLTGSGSQDVYVAAYAASTGAGQWAISAGGSGTDYGRGVATDGTNLYVGGYVGLPATFGSITLTGSTTPAGFLARLRLPPTLISVNPASGAVGTSVTLTGSNLTGATAVTFTGASNNTVTTGLTVSGTGSSQTITVTVPSGATTGSVTVTTPSGTSNGVAFTVTLAVSVTPAGPLTLCAGGSLTLTAATSSNPAGLVYTWSNGAAGPSITVSQPGDYQVTATAPGYAAGYSDVVRVNAPPAVTVSLTPAGPLNLLGGASQTLTATATVAPFNAGGSGFNSVVYALARQPDGKVLVGGNFSSYNGNAAAPDRLLRLNADGSLDNTFNAGGSGFDGGVNALALQPDGKVLVGGLFTSYNGNAAAPDGVLRLNADGSLDPTFNPGGTGMGTSGGAGSVYALVVQPDGQVLVGGGFTTYNGSSAPGGVLRLNANGSLDPTFNPGGTGLGNNGVRTLALQPDGKVLVGGFFSAYNGSPAPGGVLRLNADGSLDPAFNPGGAGVGNSNVFALALQPDGKVLMGGFFMSYNGNAAAPDGVLRLNADGSLDPGFNAGGTGVASSLPGSIVYALALQPDGQVLVGGSNFSSYNGNAAAPDRLLRLLADGSLDNSFNTNGSGTNNDVWALALQPDGKVLVGGSFVSYNGNAAAPNSMLRVNADGSLHDTPTAVPGATFVFSPGNTTGSTRSVSTAGTYTATATDPASGCAYTSNAVVVTTPAPVLNSLSANSGAAGSSLTLTGSNFDGALAVTFAGTSANTVTTGLTVSGTGSNQTITVTVPSGAVTGPVTVTTPNGTSNGLTFTVSVPDLTISTGTLSSPVVVAPGTYGTITVTATGVGQLGGAVQANTAVLVNGTLLTDCQPLTGPGSFTLAAGATLAICDPDGIRLTGNSGAVRLQGPRSYSTDAIYLYNGTVAQETGSGLPATVRELAVSNPTDVTLTLPVQVRQRVLLSSGNLRLDGLALTLLSDANGTALIANLGGAVLGSTGTLQRHIETNTAGNGYRHYASPVSGETMSTLATAGYAPNFSGAAAYNSSPAPGTVTPFPTVFLYNQGRIAGSASNYSTFDKGWQAATAADPLLPGAGVSVNAPGAALVDFTGTFTTGAVVRSNLQRAIADPSTGWHLLGNPYPSPLDWSTMTQGPGQSLENMDAAAYVFQSSGPYAGTYRVYHPAIAGPQLQHIPAGSGFFVHASTPGVAGIIRFADANRVTTFGAQPAFGRGVGSTRPFFTLQVQGGAGPADELTVYVDPAATAGVDAAYDAVKLANPSGLNLAALAGSTALAIDGLPVLTATTVVPLTLAVPAAGAYTFTVPALVNFGRTAVYLRDAVTGTEQPLTGGVRVAVALPIGTNTRFSLVLRPAGALATTGILATQTSLCPNPARGAFTLALPPVPGARTATAVLLNALGQAVSTRTLALTAAGTTADFLTDGLAAGVYALRLKAGAETTTLRLVVE